MYLHSNLDSHSRSRNHVIAYSEWKERDARSRTGRTIDAEQQKLVDAEKERWSKVECIKFSAKQSIPLRGSNEHLGDPDNGKFMQLMETIAKFDPIMNEHLRLAMQTQSANRRPIYYLSLRIQNDVISALASAIKHYRANQGECFLLNHCRLHT